MNVQEVWEQKDRCEPGSRSIPPFSEPASIFCQVGDRHDAKRKGRPEDKKTPAAP
jgi:hypothetical protein